MNPNTGEPGNQDSVQGGVAVGTPVNNVSSPDPLSDLQGVVNAAKEAAAILTPKDQFATQFGGVVPPVESPPTTPPPAEPAPDLMGQALSSIETPSPAIDASVPQPSTDNLSREQTQPVAETLEQPEPEQTPAEKLKQEIAASIDAFLEKVTKEKVAA